MGGTAMPFDYLIKEGEENDDGSEEDGEGTDVHAEIGAGTGGGTVGATKGMIVDTGLILGFEVGVFVDSAL